MNRILSLFSLGAFGLLIAGVIMVVTAGPSNRLPAAAAAYATPMATDGSIDIKSLLIGLAAGWLLAYAGRVPWLEIPARTIGWLIKNERNILRLGMAGILLAVVIFY